MAASLTPGQADLLLSLAGRIVPESARLDEAQKRRFLEIVGEALASRPPALRRQILLFFSVLRWAPALVYFAPFERLSPQNQDRVLRWFQEGPIGLFRKGFWGTKTLIFMGYYGRLESWEEISYRPTNEGNKVLRERKRV